MVEVSLLRKWLVAEARIALQIEAWFEARTKPTDEEKRSGLSPATLEELDDLIGVIDRRANEQKSGLVLGLRSHWFLLMLDNFEKQVVERVESSEMSPLGANSDPDRRNPMHYAFPGYVTAYLRRHCLWDFGVCYQRVLGLYERLAKIEEDQKDERKIFTEKVQELRDDLLNSSFQ